MFELDMSDVKPSVLNLVIVGLMAMVFIALAKYAVNTFDNPVTKFFQPLVNVV